MKDNEILMMRLEKRLKCCLGCKNRRWYSRKRPSVRSWKMDHLMVPVYDIVGRKSSTQPGFRRICSISSARCSSSLQVKWLQRQDQERRCNVSAMRKTISEWIRSGNLRRGLVLLIQLDTGLKDSLRCRWLQAWGGLDHSYDTDAYRKIAWISCNIFHWWVITKQIKEAIPEKLVDGLHSQPPVPNERLHDATWTTTVLFQCLRATPSSGLWPSPELNRAATILDGIELVPKI